MKLIITALLAFTMLTAAKAQKLLTEFNGRVISNKNAMPVAASVAVLSPKDSSAISTTNTLSDGSFVFKNIPDGNYLLKLTAVGYKTAFTNITIDAIKADQSLLQVYELAVNEKSLDNVTVQAQKQLLEQKIDKTVMNVDALISNAGSTALEALEKAPGVIVDKDGNISLKGKQGVTVMMDGKPSYLSGPELAAYLRGLPASAIDQIELMTNPSAKYDAAGNSGIINIKTKKSKQKGFNGSVALAYGQGMYPKTNNSINLNYRKNKLNFFTNTGVNYRANNQVLNINRKYLDANNSLAAIFQQQTNSSRENKNFSQKAGVDYYANKNTIVGIVFTGVTAPGVENTFSKSFLQDKNGKTDSIVTAQNRELRTWKNGAINVNFRHTLDTTGREITADFDYVQYRANKDQSFDNTVLAPNEVKKYNEILEGSLPSTIKIYSAKTDYSQRLNKTFKLETGLKFSYVNTDNMANYFNVNNGVKNIDWDRTNHFTYQENINAAYVNVSGNVKKWGLQMGLRAENTNIKGRQFGNPLPQHPDSAFTKAYTNLFPTTYISYNLNKKHQFGFSYGRRINRPDYEDLNPFLFFLDKYTFGKGNPFLRPVYAQVFEVSHIYNQFLSTTFNYSHSKDLIMDAFVQEGFATVVTQDNFGINNNASLSVNFNKKLTKWWRVNWYNEVNYREFKGITSDADFKNKGTVVSTNANNQFTFNKGWSGELSGFYRTSSKDGQMTLSNLKQVDAGIKKNILKDKGSVKLSFRDFLGPMKVSGTIDFQKTQASFNQRNDSRVVTLAFNYRFGKPIKGLKTRKAGGADAEQGRVKSAG